MVEMVEVPEEIDSLFSRMKHADSIPDEFEGPELDQLFEWIEENVETRGVKPFVKQKYDYNDTQYNRLIRARKRQGFKKTGKVDTREQLEKKEKGDLESYIDGTWADVKRIGSRAVMDWITIAQDMNYYDEDADMVDMEGFISDAVEFYHTRRPVVDELEARAKNNAAVARVSLSALRRAWRTMWAIKAYLDTLRQINPQLHMALSGLESIIPAGGEESERTPA